MTSLSLPFFNFNVSAIRTAYYPGSSLFLDGLLSQCSRAFPCGFGVKNEEKERRVQIVGTGACFRKRTQGKRGEIFSLFLFPRRFFARSLRLLAMDYPGSDCGPQRDVNWQEAPLLSFVCFYFLFCFFQMFFFSACYCHFFAFCFVFFPYTDRKEK